ncbi:MAG: hypothetical protein M1816_003775 [Peltula sp. TS41687]|nr:MAG: hypothetical protein M1816_003775 [Peltula sp. TS41687]
MPSQPEFHHPFDSETSSVIGGRGAQFHDFEKQLQENRARVRAAALKNADLSVNLDDIDDSLPLPDIHQRSIHIPTRTSSTRQMAPGHDHRHSLSNSGASSVITYETRATSILPPLQVKGVMEEEDPMEPLVEYDPGSFDLVAAPVVSSTSYSLEHRAGQLFSRDHLKVIFDDPALLLRFTSFLSACRPKSVPVLIYYFDATKALKAINYANSIADSLEPIEGLEFTTTPARPTVNSVLEEKADQAFEVLVREDLPAYITHIYTQVVSLSITRRITGTLSSSLREASEGLAEVFCLTDPTRPDNPIIFASEEFHRTTQYGVGYAIGRNCRFLQGPQTNPFSVSRLRDAVEAGREHCEVFLNYRRDGSPFMNLLMIAPLCDSQGRVRYHIGAQVDVSGIVKECTDLESLRRLVNREDIRRAAADDESPGEESSKREEFQELSEMFNMQELETVRRCGGRMHKDMRENDAEANSNHWQRPRLLLSEPSLEATKIHRLDTRLNGKLSGVYQNVRDFLDPHQVHCKVVAASSKGLLTNQYLLVRPYPSLRILFASPSLRVPGILQSPFMNKIGGSARVREELSQALVEGRGVTAKVRWVSKSDEEGRNRWIHCTPLLGSNAQVGVWMVVIVDDEKETNRRWRQAPPVVLPTRGGNDPTVITEVRKGPPPQAGMVPPPKSPGRVRTYNHPVSLNSNISLDLDELDVDLDSPPLSPSHRDHLPFSLH